MSITAHTEATTQHCHLCPVTCLAQHCTGQLVPPCPSLADTPVPAACRSPTGEGLLLGGSATVHGSQPGSLPTSQQAKHSWKSCTSWKREQPGSAASPWSEHRVPQLQAAEWAMRNAATGQDPLCSHPRLAACSGHHPQLPLDAGTLELAAPKRSLLTELSIPSSSLPRACCLCSRTPWALGQRHLQLSIAERLGKTVWDQDTLEPPQPPEKASNPPKPHSADKATFGQNNSIRSIAWPLRSNHRHKRPFPGGISQTLP